jgi:hypothetical protein
MLSFRMEERVTDKNCSVTVLLNVLWNSKFPDVAKALHVLSVKADEDSAASTRRVGSSVSPRPGLWCRMPDAMEVGPCRWAAAICSSAAEGAGNAKGKMKNNSAGRLTAQLFPE